MSGLGYHRVGGSDRRTGEGRVRERQKRKRIDRRIKSMTAERRGQQRGGKGENQSSSFDSTSSETLTVVVMLRGGGLPLSEKWRGAEVKPKNLAKLVGGLPRDHPRLIQGPVSGGESAPCQRGSVAGEHKKPKYTHHCGDAQKFMKT